MYRTVINAKRKCRVHYGDSRVDGGTDEWRAISGVSLSKKMVPGVGGET